MNTIFPYIIYLSILIFVKGEQEILISLEMNKLNPKITNEIYSKEQINIIGLSIDDTESNGVEIQFDISTSIDSPNPFAASIKYIELTKGFSNYFPYLFNIEILYLINLNIENNNIFSFSCSIENNSDVCGFYLNENLIDFDGNKFERDKINFNNEFNYILQNNTNTIIHYMKYNNTPYIIIFPEIYSEDKTPIILKYEQYNTIKCITYDIDNFFCIFIKQINETMRNIIIKHFNSNKFGEFNDINIISDELNGTKLSFNLSIINNYAFDIYKTDDNNIITCFLVNEDNLQKIICYKNTFEQLINFSLENLIIYKTCDIKKDDIPEFFNYEKISIIYVNNEHFKIILYTLNKSKYLIIDLNTLLSYITKDNEYFVLAKISRYQKMLYILNDIELTTKNNIQYLNLIMSNNENLFSTSLKFQINPSFIYEKFYLEEQLGEAILSKNESSFFNLLNYTSTNFHYIELKQTGVVKGTYKYKDIPSSLLFNYQFIIYPQFCLEYSDDALKCIKCDEGAAYMPDSSLCFSEDEIPDHYYLDTLLDYILKCEQNCFKCNMLKTGGISECIACDENYYIYRYTCVDKCPENSYFYSYKKNIKAYNYQQLMDINVCTDICEEGYTGYIYQKDNNGTINRECILNEYKSISDEIEQRFNEFLLLNSERKIETIIEQEKIIKNKNNLNTEYDFNNLNVEFLLYNDFIYNLHIVSKIKMINNLNILCEYYYDLVENYFDSIGGDLKILNNNNDNIIYFLSTLLSLFKNEELLEKIYFEKINYYFYKFGQNLTDILINQNEIEKINSIMYSYSKFINQSIDSAIDYIDPDFDHKQFESNKYYKYQKGILLNENNIKIMNLTNNLFQFLIKLDQNLYYYQNDFLSFYLQKLSVEKNDKEYILPQLGLSLIILGTESKNKTSSYTTNNISELIEKNQFPNLKIILPSLESINNQISWNECSFELIVFKDKYPFLNKNSTFDINPDFISINFIDKNHNIIKISNLKDDNLIKIIRKKPNNAFHMGNCVYYDENFKNLNDIGCNSFDLIDYIICTTNHLTDFTIASFSPSYLISRFDYDKESTRQEIIKNSHWIKNQNILSNLNSNNAIILYLNLAIFLLCIFLLIIKFLTKQEYTKVERIVEDSYVRYTINEDTETDKKILKYIIEKEIEYILKNRSDYENQKKQQLALECKNDVFNSDQKVITIIEDESDDDDEEEINDKKIKKVSFRNTVIDKRKNTKSKRYYKKESNYSLKKLKSDEKKGKNKKNKEINIEMSNVKDKEDNDFIEIDETFEDSKIQTNKYKFSFNYKNNPRKSNITNTISHRRNSSSYSNITNENNNNINNRDIVKKQSLNERFQKNVKEQKQRHIYSIFDKTLNDIKSTGQNSLETSTNIIKRPSSLIGISNALNKISNKDEEKILIKNEFFVIFKLILYILYQYEYRLISLFNKIILPITRSNLIFLIGFRLNLQLSICLIIAPRYFEDNYSLSNNILAIIATIIISDIIYTIIEVILMKKKISTSTDIKLKGIIKFRQILECLLGYILLIFFSMLGLYNSVWISLYLLENNIKCCFLADYLMIILVDNLIYESLLLCIKSFIFTYVVYQDSEGCILKLLEIFNKIFIFYLAE